MAIRRLEMPIARFLVIFVWCCAIGVNHCSIDCIFDWGLGGALFQGFARFLMIVVFPIITGLATTAIRY